MLRIYLLLVASRSAQLSLESQRRGCFSLTLHTGNGTWHVNNPPVHHSASTKGRGSAGGVSAAVWRIMWRFAFLLLSQLHRVLGNASEGEDLEDEGRINSQPSECA